MKRRLCTNLRSVEYLPFIFCHLMLFPFCTLYVISQIVDVVLFLFFICYLLDVTFKTQYYDDVN